MIKIMIADDQELIRESLKIILSTQKNLILSLLLLVVKMLLKK